MASSEALVLSRVGLWFSPAGLCLAAEDQRVPNLLCVSFVPCRLPYPGGSGGLRLLYFRPRWPSPNANLTFARTASHPHYFAENAENGA